MKLKKFLEMYDNWNDVIYINDNNLNRLAEENPEIIYHNPNLAEKKVVAFGFYEENLYIRVK